MRWLTAHSAFRGGSNPKAFFRFYQANLWAAIDNHMA